MQRTVLYVTGVALICLAGWWVHSHSDTPELVFQPPSRLIETAPMCPWRDPEADLRQFFPEATRYDVQTTILSGKRLELQQRLQRVPQADEHSLRLQRVFKGD